jgi:hypothetical protein
VTSLHIKKSMKKHIFSSNLFKNQKPHGDHFENCPINQFFVSTSTKTTQSTILEMITLSTNLI